MAWVQHFPTTAAETRRGWVLRLAALVSAAQGSVPINIRAVRFRRKRAKQAADDNDREPSKKDERRHHHDSDEDENGEKRFVHFDISV